MIDISDYELLMLYNEQNEDALSLLYERYIPIINYYLNKYKGILNKLRVNRQEAYNECLEALHQAFDNYNMLVNASLKTYASLLINRKIQKIIEKNSYKKNLYVSNNISLDDILLLNIDLKYEPLSNILDNEVFTIFKETINNILSNFELQVITYRIKGLNNNEIAHKLNKSYKQIDNALQRIKNKLYRYAY